MPTHRYFTPEPHHPQPPISYEKTLHRFDPAHRFAPYRRLRPEASVSLWGLASSLAGGLGMFFALSPDAKPFWISLLVCALCTLVIETKLLVGYMHAGPAKVAGG